MSTEPPQAPPEQRPIVAFRVDVPCYQAIMNKLQERPFKEVADLIGMLGQRVQPIYEPTNKGSIDRSGGETPPAGDPPPKAPAKKPAKKKSPAKVTALKSTKKGD